MTETVRKKHKDVEGLAVVAGLLPLGILLITSGGTWAVWQHFGFTAITAVPIVVMLAVAVLSAILFGLTFIWQAAWPVAYNRYASWWNRRHGFDY